MAHSATYISTTSFSVTGDQTDEFRTTRSVLCDCGVDGNICGFVVSSSFGSSITTVVMNMGSNALTSNLTSVETAYAGYCDDDNEVSTVPLHDHTTIYEGGVIDGVDSIGPQIPALSGHGYAFPQVNSGATALTFFDVGSANQVLSMDPYGTDQEWRTVQGTTNQVNVAFAAGTITFSTPQSIHTAAVPTFQGIILSAYDGILLGNASSQVSEVPYDAGEGTRQRLVYISGTGYVFRSDTSDALLDCGFSALSGANEGSVAYVDSSGIWQLLAPGSTGQVLTMQASGVPAWETP